MPQYVNYFGLIAGFIVLIGSLIGLYRAWYYYKKLDEPWKSLARRTGISLLFLMFGSIGTIIDSLTERYLWEVMGVFYLASYLVIFYTIFVVLRARLKNVERTKKAPRQEEPEPTPEKEQKDAKKELPIKGSYSLRKEPSAQLFHILKEVSSGLIVVSRKSREEWVEKFGVQPDEFLWLSRADVENSIDPSKLHVIQGKILQFMEQRGSVVVYFDGLEYLTLYNDFSSVAKFLFAVKDMVMIKNSLMLIHLPEGVFDKKQEIILLREFEEINEEELIKKLSQALPHERAEEIALFGVLPPATKSGDAKDASDKSPEEGGRATKEEAQEAEPLRREEKAKE